MKRFVLLIVCLLLSCSTKSTVLSPDHPEPLEPDPEIQPAEGKELCSLACDAMNNKLLNEEGKIGCEEGEPLAAKEKGDMPCPGEDAGTGCMSCVRFCEEMHDNGSFWNTRCIAEKITFCRQIESICNTQ